MRLGFAALLVAAFAARAHEAAPYPPPAFTPPAPGTYTLPPIQPAPRGVVLDSAGRAHSLESLFAGRITLLGLVYTRCADADGCPRATWAFSAVRSRLRDDPALAARVQLATLSFDPAHDTPAVMAAYARDVGGRRGAPRWWFLTMRGRGELDPVLEALGQDLRVPADGAAAPGTEAFTHTLKGFLVDPRRRVREIYSGAWLAPEMMVNDIRTLAAEP